MIDWVMCDESKNGGLFDVEFFFQIVDVGIVFLEVFICYDSLLQWDIGFDFFYNYFIECVMYMSNCYIVVFIVSDEFVDY